ncbi:DNA replication/repair protein RecF [Acetobacter sp. TBRC 12305]|uniref:DNA replication and repair protein RecF n=1 Tax=Acetobacter garciniae TaxID=2817435 RepID=A0A939KLF9_9PROT|nr:DNA replication/repair protein RecF [Acetobacter garciniae]MBO1324218.1 DNA replication/repair protein RecF [Acetobacter garciniae]MBX0343907.1 DNA replication/repair protein RecF [Acetobacter garciniae]
MPRLLKLTLSRFRNYERLTWQPDSPLLVLTGENGSGKTNLLEAVSLLAPGRGLRSAPLAHMGKDGCLDWGISAQIRTGDDVLEIGTGVQSAPNGPRRVFLLNGKLNRGALSGDDTISAVWITPQMDRLFSESASGRRRFLDRLVMAVTPQHARELAAYDRAMTQRNRLLQTRASEHVWLGGLEASMARHAVAVTAARQDTVRQLNHYGQHGLGAFPAVRLELHCAVAEHLATAPALATEDWLREQFAQRRAVDREKGRASLGSHRADMTLADPHSGQSAELASTGQQKSLLMGVILAHARLVEDHRGAPPLMLLDEPLVHLDAARRASLLEMIQGFATTVILTGTDTAPFAPLRDKAQFRTLSHGAFLPAQT